MANLARDLDEDTLAHEPPLACLPGEVFSGLPRAVTRGLLKGARRLRYRSGSWVVRAGEEIPVHLLVLRGRFTEVRSRGELWWQTVADREPGDLIGTAATLQRAATVEDVRCTEAGVLLALDPRRVADAQVTHPALGFRLQEALCRDLVQGRELAASLSLLTLEERLLRFVLEHAGEAQDGRWPFTQEEVAHHVGGCREEVTRLLARWRRKGWIEVGRRQVRLVDPVALARQAPRWGR